MSCAAHAENEMRMYRIAPEDMGVEDARPVFALQVASIFDQRDRISAHHTQHGKAQSGRCATWL
jgi:hypothetical protein